MLLIAIFGLFATGLQAVPEKDDDAKPLASAQTCPPNAPSATLIYHTAGVGDQADTGYSVTVCGEPLKVERLRRPAGLDEHLKIGR